MEMAEGSGTAAAERPTNFSTGASPKKVDPGGQRDIEAVGERRVSLA